MVAFFWQSCMDTYVLFEVTLTCWIIITWVTITFKIIRQQAWILCSVRGQIPMLTFLHTNLICIFYHHSWIYSCFFRSCSYAELSSHRSQWYFNPSFMLFEVMFLCLIIFTQITFILWTILHVHIPAVWGRMDVIWRDLCFHGVRVTWI